MDKVLERLRAGVVKMCINNIIAQVKKKFSFRLVRFSLRRTVERIKIQQLHFSKKVFKTQMQVQVETA